VTRLSGFPVSDELRNSKIELIESEISMTSPSTIPCPHCHGKTPPGELLCSHYRGSGIVVLQPVQDVTGNQGFRERIAEGAK
jgi:hypothetical protein